MNYEIFALNIQSNKLKKLEIMHKLGLTTFTNIGKIIFELSSAAELQNIEELLKPIKADGGTNLYQGLKSGYDILQKNPRDNSDKKIIFLTDMQDSEDPAFFKLLGEISKNNISIDIVGIGQNLNIAYADKVADIKNITINSAMKQEDIKKILVDNFEYNFFPVARDLKIEFLSHNLKIQKCLGTGYEQTKVKNFELVQEKNMLFKNQIKESKTNLIIFNCSGSYI